MTNTRTVADIRAAIEARDPQVHDDYQILLDEIDQLEEKAEQRRQRLAAAESDLLDIRGTLSPNGFPSRVPEGMLHGRVTPAVEWLLAEIDRLTARTETAETPTTGRLAEIEARTNAATKGPWWNDQAEIYQGDEPILGLSEWVGETLDVDDHTKSCTNAEFIAHARADVPWLIAQLKQARNIAVELENENARLTDELAAAHAGDVDHLDADGEADDEPQVIARGLTMKEAMFRLMAHSTTDPENAVAYTKAADDERETATQAHATGGGS